MNYFKSHNKLLPFYKFIGYGLIFLLFITLTGCVSCNHTVDQDIQQIPQNNLLYLDKNANKPISPITAEHLKEKYLHYFFIPWNDPFVWDKLRSIKQEYAHILVGYNKHPGWNANQHRHPANFAFNIKKNINLIKFPNIKARAITVRSTNLRLLPVDAPSFDDWYKEGHSYPFDNLQTAYLSSNVPLYVLHTTRDRAWDLVITPYHCFGWVKSSDLAYVSKEFVQNWQKQKFVVATSDNKPILSQQMQNYGLTRIGDIYPLVDTNQDSYQILMARKINSGYANQQIGILNKGSASIWPLEIKPSNIAKIANKFLGNPYGWGGIYGFRDCSSTMQALFSPFGIWLPRNSMAQADTGKYIPLEDYSNYQKEKMIIKHGQPFLTLVWLHGHIMLYIGEKNGHAYVFHNPWRLHVKHRMNCNPARGIIGRTVITTLDLGKEMRDNSWIYLDLISGMTFITQ